MSRSKPDAYGEGRQRLIDAAMELASGTRSLASLGLREVTRCAGLAPNSFYRHFKNFDELGLAAIELLGSELRRGLRQQRLRSAQPQAPTVVAAGQAVASAQVIVRDTVGMVLDYVVQHRVAYTVGMRELNGSSPVIRTAVRKLLEDFARDMADDIRNLVNMPGIPTHSLDELSRQIIRQMTFFCMDYIEQPEQRARIRDSAERFILRMFAGEMSLQANPA